MPTPELPVTFRPVRTRVVLHAAGGVTFAVFALIAALLPAQGAVTWSPIDRFLVIGCGVVAWALLAFLSRPKAVADEHGLTIINLTTKRHLHWAEIVRVSLRTGDAWVSLDLADGTSMAVMAIQPGIARGKALEDVRALRALTDSYGTAPQD